MRFDWWTFGLQTINFAVLVWLLRRFLYRPVMAMIDAREAAIRARTDAAAAADSAARERLRAVEERLAAIERERDAILSAATTRAEAIGQEVRIRAEAEAAALKADALKALATERAHALEEARRAALTLGGAFARRLLAELPAAQSTDAWIAPLERHLRGMSAADRTALLQAGSVRVVTAAALPAGSDAIWRDRIGQALGGAPAISFAVDPALEAGAELDFGGAVLRFSWTTLMDAMRAEVAADADAH